MIKSKGALVVLGVMFFVLSLITCFTELDKYLSLAVAAVILAVGSYVYVNLENKRRDFILKIFTFLSSVAVMLSILVFFNPQFFNSKVDTLLFVVDTMIINILLSVENSARNQDKKVYFTMNS